MRYIRKNLTDNEKSGFKNIMVLNKELVNFEFYRKGELWYATKNGFRFPISISKIKDKIFLSFDNEKVFEKYIDKQLKAINLEKEKNEKDNKI